MKPKRTFKIIIFTKSLIAMIAVKHIKAQIDNANKRGITVNSAIELPLNQSNNISLNIITPPNHY